MNTIELLKTIAPCEFANRFQFSKTLVVIDANVADYQRLADGVVEDVDVVILNGDRDGVKQLTAALLAHRHLTALHIVCHGSPGCLYLGNSQLSGETIDRYTLHLASWFAPISFQGTPSLTLYACSVAAGDVGTEFVQRLHELTGANIAASTTPIGNPAKGGTWHFDTLTPSFPLPIAPSPFTPDTLANYPGILAPGDLTFGGNGTGSALTGGNWGHRQPKTLLYSQMGRF